MAASFQLPSIQDFVKGACSSSASSSSSTTSAPSSSAASLLNPFDAPSPFYRQQQQLQERPLPRLSPPPDTSPSLVRSLSSPAAVPQAKSTHMEDLRETELQIVQLLEQRMQLFPSSSASANNNNIKDRTKRPRAESMVSRDGSSGSEPEEEDSRAESELDEESNNNTNSNLNLHHASSASSFHDSNPFWQSSYSSTPEKTFWSHHHHHHNDIDHCDAKREASPTHLLPPLKRRLLASLSSPSPCHTAGATHANDASSINNNAGVASASSSAPQQPQQQSSSSRKRRKLDNFEEAWEQRYLQLVDFYQRFGHCRVPSQWKENESLGFWVKTQRAAWKKGKITAERVEKLNKINFLWKVGKRKRLDTATTNMTSSSAQSSTPSVPSTTTQSGAPTLEMLAGVLTSSLTPQDALPSASVSANNLQKATTTTTPTVKKGGGPCYADRQWNKMFLKLKKFSELYGHCCVPVRWEGDQRLGLWVKTQRASWKKGRIKKERRRMLESIDFVWEVGRGWRGDGLTAGRETVATRRKREMQEVRFGGASNFSDYADEEEEEEDEGQRLYRTAMEEQDEDDEDAVGDSSEEEEEEEAEEDEEEDEVEYYSGNSESEFSFVASSPDKKKGFVVKKFVYSDFCGQLPSSAFADSDCILKKEQPFVSSSHNQLPNRHNMTQHTTTSSSPSSSPASSFPSPLRCTIAEIGRESSPSSSSSSSSGTSSPVSSEAEESSEDGGVVLSHKNTNDSSEDLASNEEKKSQPIVVKNEPEEEEDEDEDDDNKPEEAEDEAHEEKVWTKRIQQLIAFRDTYGHCCVAQSNSSRRWSKLGNWVQYQREKRREGKLSAEKEALLTSLGFVWDVMNFQWKEHFQELVEFKERFGHCQVPVQWRENPRLGSWVKTQRAAWKKGKMSAERKSMLDSIAFVWEVGKGVTRKCAPSSPSSTLSSTSTFNDVVVKPTTKVTTKTKMTIMNNDVTRDSNDKMVIEERDDTGMSNDNKQTKHMRTAGDVLASIVGLGSGLEYRDYLRGCKWPFTSPTSSLIMNNREQEEKEEEEEETTIVGAETLLHLRA
ncbi:Helicase [Balamuthia mandrillaris]